MIKDKDNSLHYYWGKNCQGWKLVDEKELTIIEEEMPPFTSEEIHFHKKARQLFYIKSGIAGFEIENKLFSITANQSVYVKPGLKHRIINNNNEELKFIVISSPSTAGDRFRLNGE
jgi:mannose-6-phosphate isomerase-like protein (cupin superfamily)